jgi:1-acyl-sn-glycerol-3-phosphate acyltransferase
MAEEEVIELAGREVRITSPGKVLFNERGETKLDLVRYYAAVAELALTAGAPIIPVHIEGTALVMPKGRGLNRRAKTKVTFARPLHPRPGETPQELTERLHDAIET